jgi:putative GTP pyrophosphokinase
VNEISSFDAWLNGNQLALKAWGNFIVAKVSEFVASEIGIEQLGTFLKLTSLRVKEVSSALKKQQKKRYPNPQTDMTDLVGARFVVLLRSDIEIVERAIVSYLRWVVSKDRDPVSEKSAKPQHFDYQSVHYVLRCAEDFVYDGVTVPEGIACEVQIRTLLQHAYAELVHDKIYKGEGHIPSSAERLVARSMALMETTDEMFVAAVKELERVNQSRSQWCTALDGAVGPLLNGNFVPTPDDHDALVIVEHYRKLLERANVQDVLSMLSPPITRVIQESAPKGGLYAKPVVLLVYWLVTNHAFEVDLDWPVPGLLSDLAKVKAHLGVS